MAAGSSFDSNGRSYLLEEEQRGDSEASGGSARSELPGRRGGRLGRPRRRDRGAIGCIARYAFDNAAICTIRGSAPVRSVPPSRQPPTACQLPARLRHSAYLAGHLSPNPPRQSGAPWLQTTRLRRRQRSARDPALQPPALPAAATPGAGHSEGRGHPGCHQRGRQLVPLHRVQVPGRLWRERPGRRAGWGPGGGDSPLTAACLGSGTARARAQRGRATHAGP